MLIQNKTARAIAVGPFLMQPGDVKSCAPNVASAFIKQGCELVSAPAPEPVVVEPKPVKKKSVIRKKSKRSKVILSNGD